MREGRGAVRDDNFLSVRLREDTALTNVSVWTVGGVVVDGRWESTVCFFAAFLWALHGYRAVSLWKRSR